jgi:hypothetical protein
MVWERLQGTKRLKNATCYKCSMLDASVLRPLHQAIGIA